MFPKLQDEKTLILLLPWLRQYCQARLWCSAWLHTPFPPVQSRGRCCHCLPLGELPRPASGSIQGMKHFWGTTHLPDR